MRLRTCPLPVGKGRQERSLSRSAILGKGVGARLFQYGLFFAKARGIESIWGMALAENTIMRRLARKMGFTVTWDGDMGAYELRMQL